MVSQLTMGLIMAGVAGLTAWLAYKDIRQAKKGVKRQKAILIYTSVFLVAILLYIGLTTFGQGYMDKLFYALGGQVNY